MVKCEQRHEKNGLNVKKDYEQTVLKQFLI